MLKLNQPGGVFIGFKVETGLRHQIEALEGPNKVYVSADDSTNLRLCKRGADLYLGKLIDDELTTDRIEDIRRNVMSILQRLFPDVRFPSHLGIFACVEPAAIETPALTTPATSTAWD